MGTGEWKEMTGDAIDDLKCEILIFFATQTEREQLELGVGEFGLPFEKKEDARVGTYFSLGTIGPNRVRAVKTRMGSFFHRGSASQAIVLSSVTSATSIIQVGMAFGIDRKVQNHGDVLVSDWLFPYDDREIEHVAGDQEQPDSYSTNYERTRRFSSKRSLFNLFESEQVSGKHDFKVHFGGVLSGGARIFSQCFLRELLFDITRSEGPGGFVGGEMEGVGLLAASEKADPLWVVVKGISDFADDQRDEEIEETRPEACLNAVRFVLAALCRVDDALG